MRRSDQRRAAVIAVYQHDLTGRPLAETLPRDSSLFVRALAHAAIDRSEELDEIIDRHAHGWSVQRIQPLERSIMRVALIEMLHPDAAPADEPIPPEGAIEDAVESALRRGALMEIPPPAPPPAEEPIPPEGAIEDAVESAKTFCGSDAPGFVNGGLAAVLREGREDAGRRTS